MGGRHSRPNANYQNRPEAGAVLADDVMNVSVVDPCLKWIYCHHNDGYTCFVQERKTETSLPWTLLT